ncbi:MAG: hypothetical protein EA427_07230 [Spirochaetaceae bacterium]|nr:MAG: hypothetical protein EA427_07230 [Spirochaetaceae bacterium]
MPDEERKALLQRISRSLNIEDANRHRIIHSEIRAERRNELIRADMEQMSVGERLRLWLSGFFTTAGARERFLALRLAQSRQRVQAGNPGLADYDSRYFLPGLPQQMRELCRKVEPIRPFFMYVWRDAESLRAMLDYLLAKRIPDSRHSLTQFCSTSELQEEFRATESRNRLRQMVLERISAYVDGIPGSVLEELENGLKPLYLFKDLVLFDFDSFFGLFQSSRGAAQAEGETTFHSVSVKRALDTVEELYLAIHYCTRIEGDPEIYLEILHFFFAVQNGASIESAMEDIPETPQARQLRRAIVDLAREVQRIRRELPLGSIIRFFRGDPYYRFIAYSPRLRLRDFYYSNLKIRMLLELDGRFHELRMGVMGRMIQEVFPRGLKEFEYFHPEIQSGIKRSGIANLQVHRPLQFVHSFIETVYRKGLMDFMRIIGRIMPTRGRQRAVDLTLFLAGMDDVMERLRNFDLSFSPDSDEGKTFYRYRFSTSERDKSQVAAYKALVTQKDRDARGIIEKFQEQIEGVKVALETIKKANHAHLNERYSNFESTLAEERPFDTRLEEYLSKIVSTQKVVKQLIAIELEE